MFRGLSKFRGERSGSQGSIDARRVSGSKNELAMTAPKQIVRALYPYQAQHDDELSFSKNDFFYVNNEPNADWYIASNPLANVTGLVPQSYFEVIQRQDPQAVPISQARRAHSRSASAASGPESAYGHKQSLSQSSRSSSRRASLAIYGFVLYDFQAERSDELTVAAGESIVIVAQSTEEWFVAKPIGRLGGPGLIPVSYVEIREVGSDQPLTDVTDAIKRANLPQVDEWKRRLAEYKASSIPLGRFGTTSEQLEQSRHSANSHSRSASGANGVQAQQSSGSRGSFASAQNDGLANSAGAYKQGHRAKTSSSSATAPAYVISASVDRFAVNGGRYWYFVKVEMSDGRHRNLCRYYQDFYDFQIKLLEQFPEEAGRTGKPRTLPFMPGPLTLVTHTVSSQRRANLDDYVRDLIRMPPHVSQSSIVLQLFSVRPGDVESSEATQQIPQPPPSESDQQYSGDMPSMMGDNSSMNSPYAAMQQQRVPLQSTAGYASGPSAQSSGPQPSSVETVTHALGSAAIDPNAPASHSRNQPTAQPTGQLTAYPAAQPAPPMGESTNLQAMKQPGSNPYGSSSHLPNQSSNPYSNPYSNQLSSTQLSSTQLSQLSTSQLSTGRRSSGQVSPTQLSSSQLNSAHPSSSQLAPSHGGNHNPQGSYGSNSNSSPYSPYGSSPYGDAAAAQSSSQLNQRSLKIKVFKTPNTSSSAFAISVPLETPFSEVYDKIATRLSMPSPKLYDNKALVGDPVDNAAKFARVLNGGTKIVLYLGN